MCARVKSLQSCLTLCDPMACSLPGSSVHGILQERIYWSGLPCPPPRGLPNPGIELASPVTTKLQSNSLPLSHWGSPFCISVCVCVCVCVCVLVAQLFPILCNPMDCSPPHSSVHGIFQARILEWFAISFSTFCV